MGKKNRHDKPKSAVSQPVAATAAPVSAPVSAPENALPAPASPLLRRLIWQLAAILGLSAMLGFTFNAANPIGVRFASATPETNPAVGLLTNFTLLSAGNGPQPAPAAKPVVASKPMPAPGAAKAPPPPSPPPVPLPAVTPPSPPPPTVPAPAAVATANLSAPAATSNAVATTPPPPAPMPTPTHWRDVKPLLAGGQIVLLDVRPKTVYDAGHIPGALSLPEASTPEEFGAFAKRHPTNTPLVFYCSSTSCSMSARVARKMMVEYHYTSVKFMTGGYLEYQREEMAAAPPASAPTPSPTNPPVVPPTSSQPAPKP